MLISTVMTSAEQQLMSNDAYLNQLPKLNRQQMAFVHSYSHLHNINLACQAAGVTRDTGVRWLKESPEVNANLDFYEAEALVEVKVTRGMLTNMLLESHRKAANSTEEIAAIREMGKMHGVYEPEKTVSVNANYTKVEQLETLSDEELLQMVDPAEMDLNP